MASSSVLIVASSISLSMMLGCVRWAWPSGINGKLFRTSEWSWSSFTERWSSASSNPTSARYTNYYLHGILRLVVGGSKERYTHSDNRTGFEHFYSRVIKVSKGSLTRCLREIVLSGLSCCMEFVRSNISHFLIRKGPIII